jgi:hypothetical protein
MPVSSPGRVRRRLLSTNGTQPDTPRDRRTGLIVALAVAVALLVFLVGYLLGRRSDATVAASTTPAAPTATATSPPPSATSSPIASATTTPSATEPPSNELPDDTYFVQLSGAQGGETGPVLVVYDLAYFLTGTQADQAAAARGFETPVPDGYFIVNDNPRLRKTPLADDFSTKYIPEGSGSTPIKAHQQQFLGWLSGSVQTDFPPKDTSWWWITIDNGEITTIKQQFLP